MINGFYEKVRDVYNKIYGGSISGIPIKKYEERIAMHKQKAQYNRDMARACSDYNKNIGKAKLHVGRLKESNARVRRLEDRLSKGDAKAVFALSLLSLSSGLLFLETSFTGNVVLSSFLERGSVVGISLMFVGLVGSFVWIKQMRR